MHNLSEQSTSIEISQNTDPSDNLDISVLDQLREVLSARAIRDNVTASLLYRRGGTYWNESQKAKIDEAASLDGRTFMDLVQDGHAEEALKMLDKFKEGPEDHEFLVFRDTAKLVLGHLNEIPDLLNDERRLDMLVRAGFGKDILPLLPKMGPKHKGVIWHLVLTGWGREVFQYLDQFRAGDDEFGPWIASAYISTGYTDLVLDNLNIFGPLDDSAALDLLLEGHTDFVEAHIDDSNVFSFRNENEKDRIEDEIYRPSVTKRLERRVKRRLH